MPSTSLASKWLRRSPVSLEITYLPYMGPFCLTETGMSALPVPGGNFLTA